jgi:urease accessory protein
MMARDLPAPTPAAASLDEVGLLALWLSPSFPVGAYAYSHGLETAVARGSVAGADDLAVWLGDLLRHGSLRNDLILATAAWQAGLAMDATRLDEINALALALQPSAERRLESVQQGTSFAAAIGAAWPCPVLARLTDSSAGEIAYPVGVAVAGARHGLGLAPLLVAFATAALQNAVSAAIRLSVMGQTDGLRLLARLAPDVTAAVRAATTTTLDDLGGAAFACDLASLEHETLYSRLFRS